MNYYKYLPIMLKLMEQLEELCFEAVKMDVDLLGCIINKNEDMCLIAVKKDGITLRYVKSQTLNICEEAVKNNKSSIQYIKNKQYMKRYWENKNELFKL